MKLDKSPLNAYELNEILPFLKEKLIERHLAGYRKEITGKNIIEVLSKKKNIIINQSRLRKMIHHICVKGLSQKLVLCASSKGYFTTSDPIIIRNYLKSFHDRIKSQLLRYQAIERDLAQLENRQQLKIIDFFNKEL